MTFHHKCNFSREISNFNQTGTIIILGQKEGKKKAHADLTSIDCLKIIIKLIINTLAINKTNHGIELAFPNLFTIITKL